MASGISSAISGTPTSVPSLTTILSFSAGSAASEESSPCTAPCEVAAYHAMGIGPTPELCNEDETPFVSAYENCAACIENLDVSPDDVLKPEIQQALEYCHIDADFTAASENSSTDGSRSSAATTTDDSSPTANSSPSETSENSETESSSDSGDDDSKASLTLKTASTLGAIAGLVHFFFMGVF